MGTSGTTAVNKIKKLLLFILSFMLVFTMTVTLTGCGSGGVDSEIAIDIPDSELVGNRVESPVNVEYFEDNNLKVVDVSLDDIELDYVLDEDMESTGLIAIEGLKNKDIQEKINNTIKDSYIDLITDTNPPPVRGSKLAVKGYLDEDGNPQPSDVYIYSAVEANFENILSVKFWKNITYGDNNDYDNNVTFYDTKSLNFDLNTGEVLKLQDLFADNVDALKYINQYTEKMLETTDYECEEVFAYTDQFQIKLTSPFKGFSEDVEFFVDDFNGSVNIVLNYKTPEFYVGDNGNETTWISIPFSEVMGYTKKFDSEESLFEDESKSYILIPLTEDESHKVRMQENPDLSNLGDMIYYNKTLEYYDYQSKAFLDFVKKDFDRFDEIKQLKKDVKEYTDTYGGEISVTRYYDSRTESIGRFETLSKSVIKSAESMQSEDEWIQIYYVETQQYITMDSKTGKVMTAYDLFVDGVDVEAAILKQMLSKKADVEEWANGNGKEFVWSDKTEKYLKEMIKSINGFRLNNRSIVFSFDNNAEVMAAEYIGCDADLLWDYAYLCTSELYFRDFGCNNLTLFN